MTPNPNLEKQAFKTAEELAKALNITSPQSIKQMEDISFSTPLELTKAQLEKLKSQNNDIESLKKSISNIKNWIVETTKEEVWEVADSLQAWKGNLPKKVQEKIEEVKSWKINWIEATFMLAVNNAREIIEKKWWNGVWEWIWKFFTTIWDWLTWKLPTNLETIITPKEKEEAKKKVLEFINEKHPTLGWLVKQWLDSGKINEEELTKITQKLKKWENLSLEDITNLVPNLDLNIDPEKKKQLTTEATNKIFNEAKNAIEKEFHITLGKEQLDKLMLIIQNRFNLDNKSLILAQEIISKKWFQFKDLYSIFWETSGTSLWLSFDLIKEKIIPPSAIVLNIIEGWVDVLKISFSWLWITKAMTYEDFKKQISDTENPELFLGLLYRKWWLLFSILWEMARWITQFWIDIFSRPNINGWDMTKNAITHNFEAQANNFKKLAQAMGDNEVGDKILREAIENVKRIEQNYNILHILRDKSDKVDEAIHAINALNIKNLNITGLKTIDELKRALNLHFSTLPYANQTWTGWAVAKKLWFFTLKGDVFDFNQRLTKILESQRYIKDSNKIGAMFNKLNELKSLSKVRRMGDKILLHFDDINSATKFSAILQDAPELAKWLFNKLPIITVAWLALTSKDKLETLRKWFLGLIPFVWPIYLIWEAWVFYDEKTWKLIVNKPSDAIIWWALLTLDGVFIVKEFAKGWVWWALKYFIKPVSDIWGIWKWASKGIYNLSRITKSSGMKEALKAWIKWVTEGLTKLPKKWKIGLAIGTATILIALWYETLKESDRWPYNQLIKEWLITKDWSLGKNLKTIIESWQLNLEEQQLIAEYIVAKNSEVPLEEQIEVVLSWKNVSVKSTNPKFKSDYFVNSSTINEFASIWFNYSGFTSSQA